MMTELDPKNSVRKEQLGNTEDTKKETEQPIEEKESLEEGTKDSDLTEGVPPENSEGIELNESLSDDKISDARDLEGVKKDALSTNEGHDAGEEVGIKPEEEKQTPLSVAAEADKEDKEIVSGTNGEENIPVTEKGTSDIETGVKEETITEEGSTAEEEKEGPGNSDPGTADTEATEAEVKVISEEKEAAPIVTDNTESTDKQDKDVATENTGGDQNIKAPKEDQEDKLPSVKEVNYSNFTKEELVDTLRKYISEYPLERIKNHVEAIKSVFYKLHNDEVDKIHIRFIEEGGKEEDFKVEDSPLEINMKELINIYRDKRNEQSKNAEEQKEVNLQAKYDIIEAIKELINSQESLNKTFHDFRSLQESWREIGPVPQKNLKDLWESYHYHVEAFYDYIKINKELRDLDFKKNLDAKLKLCEKAEELLLESSVVEAFRSLQVLHDQWREIGPVPADKRSEIWERFRDATSKINRKHQEYFVNLKEEQKKNLQEKTALCEKSEEIAALEIDNAKDWEIRSKELIDIQKIWKTIGFAPKKHNTKIYERFRAACDSFFDKKREYFASNREEQENNLQLKTELCIQAEALQDSTDWKKTTDELIRLQKRWKTIGPVPIKQSDKIWKRFRAACDTFFNSKSKFYETIDSRYEDNLKAKEGLIKSIEEFELTDDVNKNLEQLKFFQREWAEIGFVPIKVKDEIQEKYREAINNKFDQLKLDEGKKSLLKFRSRIESIISKPNADRRLAMERDKCFNKLKQLENDITLWENNIGFLSNSKNAESMITDVERKIKLAKEKIESLQEKINIIDEFD
jgi:hypothetical protein